ncbi:MAG TPA: AtpZ/AtpI family protein [Aurantimonas sp.]
MTSGSDPTGVEPETRPSGEDAEWSARRDTLAKRLAEQRRRLPENREPANRSQGMRGAAQGLKVASEFVAGIIVGAAIGYFIDQLAGTSPFGLIVFLLLGFAAGVLNVIRGISGNSSPGDPGPP